ncbi:hypothetical protein WA026_022859 [Henosepilachna vigintioctopunctata]|uniref:Uncharacterized protein n=1 Tax=Henosepilachna vigintioctopunctata TaxID=420089 RepID=A0AAW1UDA5_9CUCU
MNTPGIDPDPVPPDKGGNILATQVITNAFKMILEEEISDSFMDNTSQDLNSLCGNHSLSLLVFQRPETLHLVVFSLMRP